MKRRVRFGVVVLMLALLGAGGWYWASDEDESLADKALSDIPDDAYEQWMQELGYVD